MEEDNSQRDVMKGPKEYISVSTRLPMIDMLNLKLYCNKKNVPPSEYIRDLIHKNLHLPKKTFLSGKNRIKYNKTTNSFMWIVELDSGEEKEILNNLSDDFLKNLQTEIQEAIKKRNEWVHQRNSDSVHIPKEILGEEDGH